MTKLKMPKGCIDVSAQRRGEIITLMGVNAHGDSFVDALRKSRRAGGQGERDLESAGPEDLPAVPLRR